MSTPLADFMHDNFKQHRSWGMHTGWVFSDGQSVFFEDASRVHRAREALERSSPCATANHEWRPDGWAEQRADAIEGIKVCHR